MTQPTMMPPPPAGFVDIGGAGDGAGAGGMASGNVPPPPPGFVDIQQPAGPAAPPQATPDFERAVNETQTALTQRRYLDDILTPWNHGGQQLKQNPVMDALSAHSQQWSQQAGIDPSLMGKAAGDAAMKPADRQRYQAEQYRIMREPSLRTWAPVPLSALPNPSEPGRNPLIRGSEGPLLPSAKDVIHTADANTVLLSPDYRHAVIRDWLARHRVDTAGKNAEQVMALQQAEDRHAQQDPFPDQLIADPFERQYWLQQMFAARGMPNEMENFASRDPATPFWMDPMAALTKRALKDYAVGVPRYLAGIRAATGDPDAQYVEELLGETQQRIDQNLPDPSPESQGFQPGSLRWWSTQAARMVPDLLASQGAAGAAKGMGMSDAAAEGAALTTVGLTEGASQYEEARARNASVRAAMIESTVHGVTAAMLEKIALPGTTFRDKGINPGVRQKIEQAVMGFMSEGTTEALQEVSSVINEQLFRGTMDEDVKDRIMASLLVGGMMGAGHNLAGHGHGGEYGETQTSGPLGPEAPALPPAAPQTSGAKVVPSSVIETQALTPATPPAAPGGGEAPPTSGEQAARDGYIAELQQYQIRTLSGEWSGGRSVTLRQVPTEKLKLAVEAVRGKSDEWKQKQQVGNDRQDQTGIPGGEREGQAAVGGQLEQGGSAAAAGNGGVVQGEPAGQGRRRSQTPAELDAELDRLDRQRVELADRLGLSDQIEAMYGEGLRDSEIAKRLGQSLPVMHQDRELIVASVRRARGIPMMGLGEGNADFQAWQEHYQQRQAAEQGQEGTAGRVERTLTLPEPRERVPQQYKASALADAYKAVRERSVTKAIEANFGPGESLDTTAGGMSDEQIADINQLIQSLPAELPPARPAAPAKTTHSGTVAKQPRDWFGQAIAQETSGGEAGVASHETIGGPARGGESAGGGNVAPAAAAAAGAVYTSHGLSVPEAKAGEPNTPRVAAIRSDLTGLLKSLDHAVKHGLKPDSFIAAFTEKLGKYHDIIAEEKSRLAKEQAARENAVAAAEDAEKMARLAGEPEGPPPLEAGEKVRYTDNGGQEHAATIKAVVGNLARVELKEGSVRLVPVERIVRGEAGKAAEKLKAPKPQSKAALEEMTYNQLQALAKQWQAHPEAEFPGRGQLVDKILEAQGGKTPTKAPKVGPGAEEAKPPRAGDKLIQLADKLEADAQKTLGEQRTLMAFAPDPRHLAAAAKFGASLILRGAGHTINLVEWMGEMVAKFGESIKPHLNDIYREAKVEAQKSVNTIRDLRQAEAVQKAMEAKRVGRPDLANPGELSGDETAALVDAVDAVRNDRGRPQRSKDADVAAVAASYPSEAVERRLREKAATGGQLNDVETNAAAHLVATQGWAALQAGDINSLADAVSLKDAYREVGTNQARGLRQRGAAIKDAGQRNAMIVTEMIVQPDKATTQALRDAKAAGDQQAVETITKGAAKKSLDLIERMKKEGVDVGSLTPQNLTRPEVALKVLRAHSLATASVWDMLYEFRLNAMLDGPITQITNIAGGASHAVWDLTAQRLAEALTNIVMRDPQGARLGEFGPMLKGMLPAIADAFRAAMLTLRFEVPMGARGFDPSTQFDNPNFGPKIPGPIGRIVRFTGTTSLAAADQFVKSFYSRVQVGAEAYREGKVKGMGGKELSRYINDQVNDPSSKSWQRAMDRASEIAFQSPLEGSAFARAGGALQSFGATTPGMRHFILFVRTMTNIFRTAVRKTPAGSVSIAWRTLRSALEKVGWMSRGEPPKIRMNQAIAEQVLAWAATIGLMALGDYKDEKDQPLLDITGPRRVGRPVPERMQAEATRPPMSIKIGAKWYNYGRIEPVASMLGMMAGGLEQYRQAQRSGDGQKAVEDFTAQMAGMVVDKTFMKTLGDIVDVFDDRNPQEKMAEYVANFGVSWVPNIIRAPARASDEAIRDSRPRGKGNELYQDLASKTAYKAFPTAANAERFGVQPKIDPWGREVDKGTVADVLPMTDFWYRLSVPFEARDPKTDKADRVAMNWNMDHPEKPFVVYPPARSLKTKHGDVQMSDEEYGLYLKASGRAAGRKVAVKYIPDPENPRQKDLDKIERAMEDARELPREVIRKALEARQKGNVQVYNYQIKRLRQMAER